MLKVLIAYKGFKPGLICRGYKFMHGLNITNQANCCSCGFHCAENPLDCLNYYPQLRESVYCIVEATGDIDETVGDSQISCTKLRIIRELSGEEFLFHGLAFAVDHPQRKISKHVKPNWAIAENGYALVRGTNPMAIGRIGDVLALAKEDDKSGEIIQIAAFAVDGKSVKANRWYDINKKEGVIG